MVFDWDRAAELIREHGARHAVAGLSSDMEWTAGDIFADGKPVLDGGAYLASLWATPVLVLGGEEIECWKLQSDTPGWDANTVWPESALAKVLP